MSSLILYHGNCFDGFGSAMAVWLSYHNGAIYQSTAYSSKLDPVQMVKDLRQEHAFDKIYVLDFSYKPDILQDMTNIVSQVFVIDHHHTAEKMLAPFPKISLNINEEPKDPGVYVHFDMTQSGSLLSYQYFHPNTDIPDLFKYLSDRDLFTFELPDSKAFSAGIRMYSFDFDVWYTFLNPAVVSYIKKCGYPILAYEEQVVNTITEKVTMMDIAGYSVPVVNTSVLFSEVPHKLLELYPDAKFAAYYYDTTDGVRQWGLRSRPGFDCSEIAMKFGGGGHTNAAGFVTETPNIFTNKN